jgi:hypothetical protein
VNENVAAQTGPPGSVIESALLASVSPSIEPNRTRPPPAANSCQVSTASATSASASA